MAIDGHRSTFVGGGSIDQFTEMVDLSPNEKVAAKRWQDLKLQESLTSAEQIEFNNLTTQLSNKIFSAEKFNTLADCIVALEIFFRDNVEGYITTKQQEFDATLQKLSDKGIWSNVTTYQQWNMVTYNEETYMSMQDNNINHDPSETNSLWWRKVAGRGQQGIPGVGLSFQGNYNNSNTYSVGSAVYYNNSIYYCINSSVGNLPTNSTYWQIFLANSGIANQATEPNSPYEGMVWIDTSTTFNNIKYYNGLSWSNIGIIASKIAIIDNGNLITANNVEDALQELTIKINANKSIIDNLPKYSPASGTATAITVTTGYFNQIDKQSFTFIASVNNNGSAITINADGKGAKPLYKPNTTTAPTLIAGKAYTVWYDATKLCFFIKASAEGTANPDDVLAGETFSNNTDTGLVGTLTLTGNATAANVLSTKTFYNINAKNKETGTMPNNGDQTALIEITGSAKPTKVIPAGYTSGGTITTQLASSLASKIVDTATVGGVKGTAKEFLTAIKSIQRGVYQSPDVGTYTIPITTVDLNKAVLFISENRAWEHSHSYRARFTSSTTIEVYLFNATKIAWQVVEFENIKSTQSGLSTINDGSYSLDVEIASVNTSKAILITHGGKGSYENCVPYGELTSPTNIRLTRSNNYNAATSAWQVIEFN